MNVNLVGRLYKLEARGSSMSAISSERRKTLSDRAVLHGDLDALVELNRHRLQVTDVTAEQRAAAVSASLRADH